MNIPKIIGLEVVAIKGFNSNRRIKHIETQYLLFSDKKTYIEFEDQDYYTHHDCDSNAKTITIIQDKRLWELIMNDPQKMYRDATEDISW